MFLFDLSIALSVPIHEIKQWPITIIDQYKAYNHLRHFTQSTDRELTGFIIELLRNKNITKKSDYKTSRQMMPFLDCKLPDYLNDSRIVKMRRKLSSQNIPQKVKDKFFDDLLVHIQEEMGKEDKDQYYIEQLINIYQEHNNNKEDE